MKGELQWDLPAHPQLDAHPGGLLGTLLQQLLFG